MVQVYPIEAVAVNRHRAKNSRLGLADEIEMAMATDDRRGASDCLAGQAIAVYHV